MCFNSWMILQVWNEIDMDIFSVKEKLPILNSYTVLFLFIENPNIHESIEIELISAI